MVRKLFYFSKLKKKCFLSFTKIISVPYNNYIPFHLLIFLFCQNLCWYPYKLASCSKLYSLIVSSFTSVYITKWQEFFPQKNLRYPPSFRAHVVCCATTVVLQAYLAWRQQFCKWLHFGVKHTIFLLKDAGPIVRSSNGFLFVWVGK